MLVSMARPRALGPQRSRLLDSPTRRVRAARFAGIPQSEEGSLKKGLLIVAATLTVVFLSWSQTNHSHSKKTPLDGTWELVSGQTLPEGARDIKIISGGHFIFVAYD